MLVCTCFLPGRRIWRRANMIYRKAGTGREAGGVCAFTNAPSHTTEMILSPEIIWWRGNRWHLMFINNVSTPFQVGSVVTGCQYYFSITNPISGLCFHCFFMKGEWRNEKDNNEPGFCQRHPVGDLKDRAWKAGLSRGLCLLMEW